MPKDILNINWREMPKLAPIFDALDEAKEEGYAMVDAMPADISFCLNRLDYKYKETIHFEEIRSVYLYYYGPEGCYTIIVNYVKLHVDIWFDPKPI